MENTERVFGWDDEIEFDGNGGSGERIVLPAGEYSFEVTGFERRMFAGSPAKGVPGCPQASLTLTIESREGSCKVFDDLLLCSKFEWKMSSFFRSVGQKKKGQKVKPNWSGIVGARGKCRLKVEDYEGNDGKKRQKNRVDYYIDAEELPVLEGDDKDLPF